MSCGLFLVGVVLTALLLRSGRLEHATGPAPIHRSLPFAPIGWPAPLNSSAAASLTMAFG